MPQKAGTKLLNYTTTIEPIKTAGEVMGMLAAKGVKSINIDYNNGEPTGLSFMIEIKSRPVYFSLPCNYEGAERALRRTAPARYHTPDQAKRVAWRIVKDWVEAQLAIIECGQAEMAEVFLAYAITETGQTLFQRMTQDPSRLLTDGSEQGYVIEGRFLASGE